MVRVGITELLTFNYKYYIIILLYYYSYCGQTDLVEQFSNKYHKCSSYNW